MRSRGVSLPEVHSTKKTLDKNVLLGKQKPQMHGEQVNKYGIKIGNYPSTQTQFIDLLQGHQKIYDQTQ